MEWLPTEKLWAGKDAVPMLLVPTASAIGLAFNCVAPSKKFTLPVRPLKAVGGASPLTATEIVVCWPKTSGLAGAEAGVAIKGEAAVTVTV